MMFNAGGGRGCGGGCGELSKCKNGGQLKGGFIKNF